MRDPNALNKVEDFYAENGKSVVNIKNMVNTPLPEYDFNNPNEYKYYLKQLEKIVRHSFEYRTLITYLKQIQGMNECSYLENVSSENSSKVKIELHHEPFTLYDICAAVLKKRMDCGEDIDLYSVAEEVVYLHYLGWVGLVPVSITVHKLIHNNYLFVPTNIIRGLYRKFRDSYYKYIDPAALDYLDAAEEATLEYNAAESNKLLHRHDIYVNPESYNTTNISNMQGIIKGRITQLKNETEYKEMVTSLV